MTRVFHASSLAGAVNLAAALDAGLFGDRTQRRLLIVSNTVAVPELAPGFEESAAFAALRHRFDDVVSWNDVIAPMHPTHWQPPADELPMLSRLVTDRLGLADGVTELVVDAISFAPSAAIASLLRDCPITVHDGSLAAYGPTPRTPPAGIGRRIGRLLHLDLVPSLSPLLLREYEVEPVALDASALEGVLAELPVVDAGDALGCPVIVGEDLTQRGILSADEETELHLRALRALAARGEHRVVFLPHPAVLRPRLVPLRDDAARLGIDLVVPGDGLPAESWFGAARPSLVVSSSSAALATASAHHGLTVAGVGTDVLLERIAPYENSARIPATIVDATLSRLQPDGALVAPPDVDVQLLVEAVSYCMQADRLPSLRSAAAAYVDDHGHARYFKKRRLESLGLLAPPTPPPPPPAPPTAPVKARRVARKLLADVRTVADKRRGPT